MAAVALVDPQDATHVAVSSGNWFDAATWENGLIPDEGARVHIPENLSVTYAVESDISIFSIGVAGELRFDPTQNSKLVVDKVVVASTGRLEIGTTENPVSDNVTVDIVIAGTQNKGFYGIGSAHRTYEGNTNETRVITAIDGDTITFDRALEYDHPLPRADLKTSVANYIRSITIRSEDGANSEVYERGHVMFMASQDVDVRYAAFDELGRTEKSVRSTPVGELETVTYDSNVQGRYSLHLHQLGVENQRDSITIEGNAVTGSPGWGIAEHSTHANLQNNATLDIFGASYVAEAGDETGSWIDNISIRNEGVYNIERNHDDVDAFDLGRTGNGFWLQSRMVETVDNTAVAARTGFVWVAQGAPEGIDPATFDQLEALGLADETLPRDLPMTLSHGNEVFGSERGLTVTKGDPNQGHDIRSVLEDFTAWEVRSGVNVEYTSHYTFIHFDLIAAEHDPKNAFVQAGFLYGNNVSDMVIVNSSVVGFEYAYDFSNFFSPSLDAKDEHKQFFIVASTDSDNREGRFEQDDWELRTTFLEEVPHPNASITLDMEPLIIGAGVTYPNLRFFGVKNDSLGAIPTPAGTDTYELSVQDLQTIANTDGYYPRDGKHVMIVEAVYQDRITGELTKVGHFAEAQDLVRFGGKYFPDAIFNGVFPKENLSVDVSDDAAETAIGTEVVINLLANDADQDDIGTLTVDGIQQPRNGRVFDNEDGADTYVPDYGFSGTDIFAYFATDGLGTFEKATVTVEVRAESPETGDGGVVPGTSENDVLVGTDADDMINAFAGDDVLAGGGGINRLIGGDGEDQFVFAGDDSLDMVYD